MKSIQDIIKNAQLLDKMKMVVAVAQDEHVLEAVHMAKEAGIIDAVLVGNKTSILGILKQLKINPNLYEIIDMPDQLQACDYAVKMISDQKATILMKGLVDTSIILRAALDKDFGLRTPNRLSHVSVMEVPTYHKLLLMSDGAMNIDPNVDIKQEIIENGVLICQALGIKKPKVGCIAAIEKVNPKMQATLDAVELIERNKVGRIKNCIIGGPFALDNAINLEAAIHKGVTDPMAGDVDFLLMPQIESGNVFYKTMMFLANAKSASIIAGAKAPIVLTSRADSKESKFNSIALAALVAHNKQ
jgi:phosphate butyryltransferase